MPTQPTPPKHRRSWWNKLKDNYRLVIVNEDTLEEMTSFYINRKTVYVGICTGIVLFLLLAGLFIAVTPLKYYIPGYGDLRQRREYLQLNMKLDSLEKKVSAQTQYINGVKQVLQGGINTPLDTTMLKLPPNDNSTY